MLTLNVTNRIIMKITVGLIPTRQRFDNCLLKKINYRYRLELHLYDEFIKEQYQNNIVYTKLIYGQFLFYSKCQLITRCIFVNIGCFFKFHLVISVEKSIVETPDTYQRSHFVCYLTS
jgi:hypothetical protein